MDDLLTDGFAFSRRNDRAALGGEALVVFGTGMISSCVWAQWWDRLTGSLHETRDTRHETLTYYLSPMYGQRNVIDALSLDSSMGGRWGHMLMRMAC